MGANRTSSSAGHAAKAALSKPAKPKALPYAEILRALPLGVVLLHLEDPQDIKSLKIIDLNPAAAEITAAPRENLLGKTLGDFPKLFETGLPERCLAVLESGEPKVVEQIRYGDEYIRQGIYSVRIFSLPDNFLGIAFENTTGRLQAEQALRESEERLPLLIQDVREYAIFQLDPRGNVVNWNAGAEHLKGYRAEEIIGKHFSIFYPEEEAQQGKPDQRLREAGRNGQSTDEGWRIRKDGTRFWAYVVITALRDTGGQLRGFTKVTCDMTERREKEQELTRAKELLELRNEQRATVLTRVNQELRTEIAERQRAEEQLRTSLDQLRALADRLQTVREAERTSISREIHDELGQACTAIKMDLALIGRRLTKKQTQLRAKVDSAMQLADSTIASLRRIASELRPRTLDDLGLVAALESQAQEFESRTGIRCSVSLPQESIEIDAGTSTAIFRIFQESLTNVARHAQATRVGARLEKNNDRLIFHVSDDGIGFDPAKAGAKKSLGIVGMQERALMLNGELKIESAAGQGTALTLTIPLLRSIK
jgi:PAS domain S-box-containing protein